MPRTEESSGLQSMGLQWVRHDWATEHACTRAHTHTHTHTASQEQSLVSLSLSFVVFQKEALKDLCHLSLICIICTGKFFNIIPWVQHRLVGLWFKVSHSVRNQSFFTHNNKGLYFLRQSLREILDFKGNFIFCTIFGDASYVHG